MTDDYLNPTMLVETACERLRAMGHHGMADKIREVAEANECPKCGEHPDIVFELVEDDEHHIRLACSKCAGFMIRLLAMQEAEGKLLENVVPPDPVNADEATLAEVVRLADRREWKWNKS